MVDNPRCWCSENGGWQYLRVCETKDCHCTKYEEKKAEMAAKKEPQQKSIRTK